MIYQLRNQRDLGQNPVGRIQVAAEFESLSGREKFVRNLVVKEDRWLWMIGEDRLSVQMKPNDRMASDSTGRILP